DREHLVDTVLPEPVEAVADDGSGEFEIAEFDRLAGEALPQMLGEDRKFLHGIFIAAAVAAQHHTGLCLHGSCLFVRRKKGQVPGTGEVRLGFSAAPALAPIWVGRTGLAFSSLWNAARLAGLTPSHGESAGQSLPRPAMVQRRRLAD